MKKILPLFFLAITFSMCQTPEPKEAPTPEVKETPKKEVPTLEAFAEFDTRPGNVAVSKDGRVFTTMHPLGKSDIQLYEVKGKNDLVPFPNLDYQKNGAPSSDDKIDTPLGIRVDQNNVLWIIDMGQNLGKTRLFGFDINTQEEVFRLDFPEKVAPKGAFIQDLAVDEKNGWVYLADIADPGILAVNTADKTIRRFSNKVLEAEDIDMVIGGKVVYFGGAPARVAVNPITLSQDRNTLFFGSMNGTKWYSLPATLFRDQKADAEISEAITIVGDKPISDGVATSASGAHYFTNLPDNGIDVLDASGVLKPVIRDQAIDWADNVAIGPDNALYFIVNQLHKTPAFTGGEDIGKPPFYIYRYAL